MRSLFACAIAVGLFAGCGDDGGRQDLGPGNDLAAGGDDMPLPADMAAAHWQQLFPANDPTGPQPRSLFATTWDGSRLLLHGGSVAGGDLNDFWAFNPSSRTWTQLTANGTASAAPARDGHGIAWTGSRVVLWGGRSLNNLNDTWTWDGTNGWQNQNPSNPPPGTPFFGMTWNGRYVVIYGGGGNGNAPSATVYGYDPVANGWSVLVDANATPSPGALESATIASSGSGSAENPDAGSGVGAPVLLFGGSTTFTTINATWSMVPGSGWTLDIFEGANGSPPDRGGNLLFWDGAEYLTFGGGGPNGVNFTDVWTYAPATKKWTQISPNNARGAPATASKFYNGAWAGTQLLVVLSDSSVWSFTP